jgi:aryl-alcohol dehydrogenase-like predicted oxidoreductase
MKATLAATQQYFERFPGKPHVRLGKTGWQVSPVGWGGYRASERVAEHGESLRTALLFGCNLIDTSTNYTDGGSERCVGKTLQALISEGRLKRQEVVIVTKAGYVQGENLMSARERESSGKPFPDMVKFSPDCWHCISPEFLEDQISRSLQRLQVSTIDVLLLHNPEYFLKTEGSHEEYYQRIRKAFEHLENEAKIGRIQYYGISSNSFPDPKESPEFTSLETVVSHCDEIGPDHHFAVIQFPMNLYEPGAVIENNNAGKTVVEFALLRGIGTLVNRPLNAFAGDRMVRLANFPPTHEESAIQGLQDALSSAMSLEAEYPGRDSVAINRVAWGHIIRENMARLSDLEGWKQTLHYQIRPTLLDALSELRRHDRYSSWVNSYEPVAQALFASYTSFLEAKAAAVSSDISRSLEAAVPRLRETPTLSRKAIQIYRSFPGIDCILVGMRRPQYVEDIMALDPPLTPEQAFDAIDAVIAPAHEGH